MKQWLDITTLAPLVASQRLSAVARDPAAAKHWSENVRMVSEKVEAFAESGAQLWWAGLHAQQLAWLRAWRAGRTVPSPEDFAPAASTMRRVARSLQPVSRRVRSNASRLAAKKR